MPPMWCERTHYSTPGRVDFMAAAGVTPGLVSAGEVNVQPSPVRSGSLDNPATWSTIFFISAVVYLLGIYFGLINVAGGRV
jgi:hypothetical protein